MARDASFDLTQFGVSVRQALQVLINLLHRGACGCEANTGDGAGILIQMPDRFLRKEAARLGLALPPARHYGAGFVFLPRDPASPSRHQTRKYLTEAVSSALAVPKLPAKQRAINPAVNPRRCIIVCSPDVLC